MNWLLFVSLLLLPAGFEPTAVPEALVKAWEQYSAADYPAALNSLERLEAALTKNQTRQNQSILERANLYLLKGMALQQSGDHKGAIGAFNQALSLNATSSAALYQRSISEQALGTPALAIKSLDEALWLGKITIPLADIYFEHARANLALHREEQALTDLQSALNQSPQHSQAARQLAQLLTKRGDRAGARQALEAALNSQPEDAALKLDKAEVVLEMAHAVFGTRELNQSRALIDQVLADPNQTAQHPRARLLLSKLLAKSGDLPAAKSELAKGLKLAPQDEALLAYNKQLNILDSAKQP